MFLILICKLERKIKIRFRLKLCYNVVLNLSKWIDTIFLIQFHEIILFQVGGVWTVYTFEFKYQSRTIFIFKIWKSNYIKDQKKKKF